jgi:hypothetical protein
MIQLECYCLKCKNHIGEFKCRAFPDRIPDVFLAGIEDHREPYEGDNGIQFEPREENENN